MLSEARLEESTVGGHGTKIKVRKVNVWPYFQQPFTWTAELLLLRSEMTSLMSLRGQRKHTPTWMHYLGKIGAPADHL